MKFELPTLPYSISALSPFLSQETMEYHYGKHHNAYVNNLNTLIAWTEYESMNLEEIIMKATWPLFNNAAQVWNHTFYFYWLTPSKIEISSDLLSLIERDFWSFDSFKAEFSKKALSNFGSWWTWLVLDESWKLQVLNTANAENPLTSFFKPLLTLDIWEHAYYIDYRNVRASYIEKFWDYVNWDFVEKNLKK